MASEVYGAGVAALVQGDVEWKTGGTSIKAKLCLAALTYSDAHDNRDDVTSAGDTTGATDVALTLEDPDSGTADKILLKADSSMTFTTVATGQSVGSVVVYKDSGAASTDTLLAFLDIAPTDTNGGDITVTVPSDNYIELSY